MKKILLLSNSLSNNLGIQLEAEGYCVDYPHNKADKWIEDVQTCQPDVIIMEIIPDNSAECYQLCYTLRQEISTENLPILLLGSLDGNCSAISSVHYLLEGLDSGANDYINPPYEFAELASKVGVAFRLRESIAKSRILVDQLEEVNNELYQRNIQVEKELYVTRQLQHSLLPSSIRPEEDEMSFTKLHYENEKLRISGVYLPCDALGGDLYDVLKFQDDAVGVSITDVSGHGVPAGFITAIFKTSLYRYTHQVTDPSQVLFHINNELFNIVKTGDYVTSVYLRIDLKTLRLDCSGAGHPYPFYYNAAENSMSRLQKNGTPLVWVKDMEYPTDSLQLVSGDKVFLFTDGVSELRNSSGEMFGEQQIQDVIMAAISSGEESVTDVLIQTLSDYTEGSPLEDDITMVLIEAL